METADPEFGSLEPYVSDGYTYFPTKWKFPHPAAWSTVPQPLQRPNIDPRTLFRIKLHFSTLYPESRTSWVYIDDDYYAIIHLCIDSTTLDLDRAYNQLWDLIEDKGSTSQLYPIVDLRLINSYHITKLNVTHLYIINNIAYVDLDSFSDLSSYQTLYYMYLDLFNSLIAYCQKRALICVTDPQFVLSWKLRTVTEEDFINFTKLIPPSNLDLWIVNPKYTNVKIKVVPQKDLYSPIVGKLDFYLDRLAAKPFYYNIGLNPVVWHYVALEFPGIWIIDGYIEIPMNSYEDLEHKDKIKMLIVSATGTVRINLQNPKDYRSVTEYYLGPEKEIQVSYLF